MQSLEEFISKLNAMAFLEEFTFSKNKFSPDPRHELELADSLIWLGDHLTILQLKERSKHDVCDAETERQWFANKVLKKGTKQIRDSCRYLAEHESIQLTNERGHTFDIAAKSFNRRINLIVYLAGQALPDDCRQRKGHVSSTAGYIHIVEAHDYLEICKTLRVPEDIFDYFSYRERTSRAFPNVMAATPEPALVGQFLSGRLEVEPTRDSIGYLQHLIQDAEEFDLSELLRSLHRNIEYAEKPHDYYQIMIEFARLPRSAWREVKTRVRLSIEKAKEGKFARPYRMTYPGTGCGFVFVPIASEVVQHPDWPTSRVNGIKNFTLMHKYDQRLDRCIGVQFAREGEDFLIDWCRIEYSWKRDLHLEQVLARGTPFRDVKEKELYRFRFANS